MTAEKCATCTGARYCAPLRCYCGHEACPAFATWIDPWSQPYIDATSRRAKKKRGSTWDNREGETWIDQL